MHDEHPTLEEIVFAEAFAQPAAARRELVEARCGNDSATAERVMDLLRAYQNDSGYLETPAPDAIAKHAHTTARAILPGPVAGDRIGRYHLLERIGEGGFGIVFLAEQEEPVRRRVALKVIKLGLDTREFIARFEAERQALALMDHPNIARVYDAGATDLGRPYLVMELIRGTAITAYCDARKLPLAARLRLFLRVCSAIQHAHQKGVIHRDLKPSNILVSSDDDSGSAGFPKVIDFGIAKAMHAPLTDRTLVTRVHALIGTPAYTSPEQLEASGLDVDTRADIYSLGVLLYELLTGRQPFDRDMLERTSLEEMRRIIREVDPPRPSARVRSLADSDSTRIAQARGIEPANLPSTLHSDLDWIVMRCLEKDRTRRYQTANALAADIERHLNDEPVVARPPSAAYRIRKTIRRHRVVVVAGAAVALALVLGIVASTWQAVRAHAQELVARQRAYASDMILAQHALRGNNLGRTQVLLDRQRPQPGQSDLRGWEWRYLWQQSRSDALSDLCRTSEIESLTVSADGRWLAIGTVHYDGLFVWDLQTRKEVAHLAPGTGEVRAVFSPAEPLLAFITNTRDDQRLRMWNATTQREVSAVPVGGADAGLAFSRDGLTLVTSTGPGLEGELVLWRVSDGTRLASFPSTMTGIGAANTSFTAAQDLSVAAYASDKRIRVIDLHTGEELWSAEAVREFLLAAAISPDGKLLATAGGYAESDIRLWDMDTGVEVGRLEGHTGFVASLMFWPDGTRLASASGDKTIRTWDIASRTCTDVLRGHRSEVWRLALLRDNRTLVSGGKDGVVSFWNTSVPHARQDHVTWPEPIVAWSFASDGRTVLTANAEGHVERWSGHDFQVKETLLEAFPCVAEGGLFSQDRRTVACAYPDGLIGVWDIARPALVNTFKPAGTQSILAKFLGDGSRLVLWSPGTQRFIEWDLVANQEVQSWPASPSQFLLNWGLSPDERLFVSAGVGRELTARHLIEKRTTTLRLDMLEKHGMAFSPSGKLMAMTSAMGYAKVWETATWQEVATLPGYLNGFFSAAFSPDGNRLAIGAGSNDEALKLWAVDSWQEVLTLPVEEGHLFINAAFSPDGNALGVMTVAGKLHVWRAPSYAEIEAAEAKNGGPKMPAR